MSSKVIRQFKFFFTILIVAFTSFEQTCAQDYYGGDMRFGLGVAPNISWYNTSTEDYENNGSRFGWAWGLDFDYFFAENYALSTGLKILNYGGELSYPDIYNNGTNDFRVTGESTVKMNAVQLPIALKMRTALMSAFNFYGKFGLNTALNYNRSEDYFTDPDSNINFEEDDRDFGDQSRFLNFGILVGAGMEYNLSGTTTAVLGITFHQGILNQLNQKAYIIDNDGQINPSETSANGPKGEDQKATINFLALELGIFF